MGFLDKLTGKKEEPKEEVPEKKQEVPEGKYSEDCSVCGDQGTEKKWMGQYFHKKCLRAMKKQAKKML
tara:strand:+ start:3399 stop:3602 length:204 start_codon:yes stop_codon:yes gene_type:complete